MARSTRFGASFSLHFTPLTEIHTYRDTLQDNQALVNLTVNYKYTFVLPFFWQNKCTVSASVVQFNPQ